MMGNVQDIAEAIKNILSGGPVAGGRLSADLKARQAGWNPTDFGVRTLRQFIAEHVPEVVVAGRSGLDVLYALKGAPVAVTPVPTEDADFWRVWVSPNSPEALAVDRTTGAVHSVPRRTPVEAHQLLVEPPGISAHREIASAFLPRVSTGLRDKLQVVVDSQNDEWWQSWLRELRGSEYLSEWYPFRHQQLTDLLRSRLLEGGIASTVIDGAVKTVRDSHPSKSSRSRRITTVAQDVRPNDELSDLRRLVSEAVQRMSIAELRELRIPLGLVLDIQTTSKSR